MRFFRCRSEREGFSGTTAANGTDCWAGGASSVFPAPIRPVLAAQSYREACEIRYSVKGGKMSQLSWAIVPQIREIAEAIRADGGLQMEIMV